MRFTLAALATIATLSQASNHPVRQELVDEIKQKTTLWTPKEVHQNKFAEVPVHKLRGTTGNLGMSKQTHNIFADYIVTPMVESFVDLIDSTNQYFGQDNILGKKKATADEPTIDLPENFDWREEMPECIGEIQDQLYCGSCWAFSSAGHLSDRFCIHSEGLIKVSLAPQDSVSCNYENYGCDGGYLVPAIDFLQAEGIADDDCMPYQDEIEHCNYKCIDSKFAYKKHYCTVGSMVIAVTEEEIKQEVYMNGPMIVALEMWEDFYNYEGGIYEYTAGEYTGGHSMKLLGWGVEDDVQYWILQNQWSMDWGEDGFVKVKFGEIAIDVMAMSCLPEIVES